MAVDAVKTSNIQIEFSSEFTQQVTSECIKDFTSNQLVDISLVFYPGFTNKRPRSAIVPTSGISLDYSLKKYGSASLKIVNANTGLRIQTIPGSNIQLGTGIFNDFVIEFWTNLTSVTGTANTYRPIIRGWGWEIGFRWNASLIRSCFATYDPGTGTNYTYEVPDPGTNAWYKWRFSRSNNNITFTVGSNSDTTSSINLNAVSFIDYIELYLTNGTINIDEFYFARKVSEPQYYSLSGEINDGALETTEALFHFNGDYSDTIIGIEPGQNINLSSAFTLTATSGAAIEESAILNSIFTQTVIPTKFKDVTAELNSTSTINCLGGLIKTGTIAQSSEFTGTVTAKKIISLSSSLTAFVIQLTANVRTRDEIASLHSEFTLQSTLTNLGSVTANLTSTFTETVTANRIKLFASTMAITASELVIAKRIAGLRSACQVTASEQIIPSRLRSTQVQVISVASQLIVNARIRAEVADLDAKFNLNSIVSKSVRTNANLNSLVTLIAYPDKIEKSQANLTSQFNQQVSINKISRATVSINCVSSLIASITTVVIDPDLTYIIPRETRFYQIPVDIKQWQIVQENRTFKIEDK